LTIKVSTVFIDRDGTIGGSDTVVYPGEFSLFSYSREWSNVEPDYIAEHFLDAVKWILRDKK
jgi:histidinol phosphatase-like enzyme